MDFLLGIVIGVLLVLAVLWSARIEKRRAEQEDRHAMQKCKEADERSLKESVERVKEHWVDVGKPELETQEAAAVEDEAITEEVDCKAVMLAYKHLMEVGALGD